MQNTIAKNRIIKVCCVLLTLSFIACFFTGCGKTDETGNYTSINGAPLESGVYASNTDYELFWDNEASAVLLNSLNTEKHWSDILYDSYLEGTSTTNGTSAITITVVDITTLEQDEVRSSYEIEDGYANMVCKKLDDGIRITYFFDRYEIAVPIEYRLVDDSLKVSIIASKILESGERYKLAAVTLVPNLCSAKNSQEGSYLFVPSGSGALMYTAENADGVRQYSGEVYGEDYGRQKPSSFTDDEQVYLPIFGVSEVDTAMLGIIENGAGAATIEAQAGNSRLGYSTVGVKFYMRNYDEFRYANFGTGNITTSRFAEELTREDVTVGFYPLYGDDANYNGMAKRYRKYLEDNNQLSETDAEYSPYSVSIIGGTEVTKTVMGVPKTELVAMTTFSMAQDIISSLTEDIGIAPIVRMMYYGDRGITPGSIGTDSKFSSVYGNKKDLAALNNYCDENNVSLFMDSEIIQFTKSGNGVSKNYDSAKTAIMHLAERHPYSPIRLMDEDKSTYVVSRELLTEIGEKSIENILDSSFKGISFSSLGAISYSDHSDGVTYANKKGIEEQVQNIFNSASEIGLLTSTSGANSYAAVAADILFDVSTENGDYDALDEQIPFYQMVFGGYRPMYSTAVNVSANYDEAVVKAVASGMGLGFTICGDYIDMSDDLTQYKLYATYYDDNVSLINELLTKGNYKQYFDAVDGSGLSSYEILGGGVSKSTFNNGTVIYANHNSSPADSPIGVLAAYGYQIG